jgi:hypothetical protein
MNIVLVLAAFLALAVENKGETASATVDQLGFIAGSWSSDRGGLVTEEMWSAPKAGTMLGVGRTMKGDKTVFFEFLRIETREGNLFYVAQPRGGKATAFKLTSFDGKSATFENPEHDFPQKIVYEKVSDDVVRATVSGPSSAGEKNESWEYRRVR